MRTNQTVSIIVTFLFILSAFTGGAYAQQSASTPDESVSIQCDSKSYTVDYSIVTDLYNNNTDSIPDIIKPALRSNTTELQIENAQQQYYTVNTDKSMQITSIELGQPDSKDVVVNTDRDTACSLYTAENPVSTFQTEYSNGNIDIEPQGTIKSAVVFVIEKVSSFLG